MQRQPTQPSNSVAPAHIGSLDGLRALSIVLVLITHTAPVGPASWRLNEMTGLMGMSLFFCLSGFLIVSMLWRNADAVTFFIRRTLRIVPPIAIYLILMAMLFGVGWRALLENALFVSNYFYDGRGRGDVSAPMSHLWSLSVEMQFYVAIGLATLFMGRRSVWLIPPAMVIVTLVRVRAGAHYDIGTHLRVDEILSGGTLALVTMHWGEGIKRQLAGPKVAVLVVAGATGLWALSCHSAGDWVMYLRPYTAALLVGILIHCRLPVLHDMLESRIAAYVARISYALYIYHPLMVWGWMNEGTTVERYLFKRPVSWVLSVAAAHISTFYWESRWQEMARRMTGGRRPAGNA